MRNWKAEYGKITSWTKTGGIATEKQVTYLNSLLYGMDTIEVGKIGKEQASRMIDHLRTGTSQATIKSMVKGAIINRVKGNDDDASADWLSLRGLSKSTYIEMMKSKELDLHTA